jgi:hypothetical protein
MYNFEVTLVSQIVKIPSHLNVISAISEFEVPFLDFPKLSFQRFFSSRTPKLPPGVPPMAGPVVLRA